MRVLVGVDDSTHAETTLEFVKKMPWPPGTEVVVASAVQMPMLADSEMFVPNVDTGVWLDELTKLHENLASAGARKLTDAGMRAAARVLHGDPREALIEEAQQERADLIVVGSHGRTGIGKLLMGSVATHVMTHAPCSVLVVRGGAPARQP